MAITRKPELIHEFITGVKESGWNAILINTGHPAKLSVFKSGFESYSVLLYIWNITHGGYPRDPNELRIQITGVSRFNEEEGVKTLVLGYSSSDQIFVGYDVSKHRLLGSSPSFQIRREAIESARNKGFCAQNKGNGEIAIAFRKDFVGTYVQELEELHKSGSETDYNTLEQIAESELTPKPVIDIPASPRKIVMQSIQRKVRDARFRTNILNIYEHRCAISGIQLDLLDAAHIIPVEHETGTDEIKNGICLSSLHHRAFDNGLIGIRSDYSIIINEDQMNKLHSLGWDGGKDLFRSTLRDHINLPMRREYYPSVDYLVEGQLLRGWNKRKLAV
jgi:putative restriction endonuclease